MDKLLLPVVMPGIVIVLAFVQLYGESSMVTSAVQLLGMEKPPFILTGLPGILIIHGYTQYVYFYISVSIAMVNGVFEYNLGLAMAYGTLLLLLSLLVSLFVSRVLSFSVR